MFAAGGRPHLERRRAAMKAALLLSAVASAGAAGRLGAAPPRPHDRRLSELGPGYAEARSHPSSCAAGY